MTAIGVLLQTLDNRSKLNVVAIYLLKEIVEFIGKIGIIVIDNSHSIPVDIVAVEHFCCAHYSLKSWFSVNTFTILIMKLSWAVN